LIPNLVTPELKKPQRAQRAQKKKKRKREEVFGFTLFNPTYKY
jgi:hypothetical protein